MIKITEFSKKPILYHVNMEIMEGITYIKGKNGSGKTTLLDCLAGIDKDYLGIIEGNKDVIYLNQQLYFYGRIKSKDLIQFFLGLNGIKDYLTYYESYVRLKRKKNMLRELYNKPIGLLSGGELKLLYFSIISSMDRSWYIFDEPFAQVDEDGKKDMIDVFTELRREGRSVIITSHEEGFLHNLLDISIVNMDNL
ncbi:ATP-binding cassette domain-containing protein [Lacrimispora sp.]|uniref:ATP-binding cassette domain-containing protein n=1 Tax=Lacrimispora sp. TaxID=2719234 RepID=UPI0028663DB4|nr:ATP-binding cassette domain-containing protein [Lacrimispora sp.]MDR7811988.1 ATP-binding cassette domain-containing protein [Lacrimispora sp.]